MMPLPRKQETAADEESQVFDELKSLNGSDKGVKWYLTSRNYSWRELIADRVVLITGAVASWPASFMLIDRTMALGGERLRLVGVVVYCCGMIAMLNASMLFHLNASSERWAHWFLFFDKIGINFMIAGTYTLLCICVHCYGLLALECALVIFGLVWEISLFNTNYAWKAPVDIMRFICAGWACLIFIPWLVPYLKGWVAWCILVHGILYTVGTVALRSSWLEFHYAVWHSCVLIAAGIFYYCAFIVLSVGPPFGQALGQTVQSWAHANEKMYDHLGSF
jgi:hemolysin III